MKNIFINITKDSMELHSYESEQEFKNLLIQCTRNHLYPQNKEGFIHAICWLYDNDKIDRKSIEFVPYYDAYCIEDGTRCPGAYLKYKYIGSNIYYYVAVVVNQEEANRLINICKD